MNNLKAFVSIGLLLVATFVHADTAETRLQRYLDDLSTLEADFRQKISSADAKVAEESSGRFYLHRPGRLRWDYLRPNVQTIVADGTNLWLYDKDLEQVTVKSIDDSMSGTPAMLLSGKENVADGFTVSEGGKRKGLHWIRMQPKRNDTDFIAVELGFADAELRAMELKDKLGQTTHIEFSGVKRNTRLDESLFQFKPPAGADVIGTPRL